MENIKVLFIGGPEAGNWRMVDAPTVVINETPNIVGLMKEQGATELEVKKSSYNLVVINGCEIMLHESIPPAAKAITQHLLDGYRRTV